MENNGRIEGARDIPAHAHTRSLEEPERFVTAMSHQGAPTILRSPYRSITCPVRAHARGTPLAFYIYIYPTHSPKGNSK